MLYFAAAKRFESRFDDFVQIDVCFHDLNALR